MLVGFDLIMVNVIFLFVRFPCIAVKPQLDPLEKASIPVLQMFNKSPPPPVE